MIMETLKGILSDSLGCDEGEITPDADLRCDLGLNEGELLDVLDALAGELGFAYEEGDLEDITTVASLVRYAAARV